MGLTVLFTVTCTILLQAGYHAVRNEKPGKDLQVEIFSDKRPGDSVSFTLPFSRAGNLILVKGRADTTEGNFILDTGCPYLVLNMTYFRSYTVHGQLEGRGSVSTGEFTAMQTQVRDFSFGAAGYTRLTADLANLGHIENSRGVKILGLIGMQMLEGFEMIIDYENNLIHMHRIHRKQASVYRHDMLSDTSAYYTVPIQITDNRIMVHTTLAGKKLKLIIDSGAETNLIDSRLPDRVFEKIAITGRTMLSGVGSSRVEVLTGDLSGLVIGNRNLDNLPVLITNLEKTCFSYGGCVDGVLGFDFLSLKKIGFNFVTNKMYIWK